MRHSEDNLRHALANVTTGDGQWDDNLAILLCSYFEDHPDCPDDSPEDEYGWKEWATQRADAVLDKIVAAARAVHPTGTPQS